MKLSRQEAEQHLAKLQGWTFEGDAIRKQYTFADFVAAVALGAVAIEKHVTLDRSEGGVDAAFSLEPEELAKLVSEVRQAWSSLGRPDYRQSPSEVPNMKFRRSIYAIEDIEAGDIFDSRNLRVIRPGYGLAPRELPKVLGRRATRALKRGTALTSDSIEDWESDP